MADEKKDLPSDKQDEVIIDYREVGATGLKRFSGFIYEEFLNNLTGWKGIAVYKEMSLNDPIVGAMLFAVQSLCRKVNWRVQSASEEENDTDAAEFLETSMNDMSQSWLDTMGEILSFIVYGFSVHEIVYKRRCGDSLDPSMRSKYSDGRIGWRKLSIRSQDSIYRWQFDDHGGIQGVEQLAPPHYYHVTIPIEKFLLFRTTIEKNNPEGRSMLRNAYRPWYMKKNIENIEAIGVERDLAGLPMALVPPELLSPGATTQQQALLQEIKKIVTNVRRDEQEGIVFPASYDATGKALYEFKLLSTGGSRQFDTDKIIKRYDQDIAMTMLADFLLLGQNNVGSFALASSKTEIFTVGVGAILDIIADVFNRFAIPRLFGLNDFQISEYPKIVHGDLANVDLTELAKYIQALATAGMPLFPDVDLENYLRKAANLPEMKPEEADVDRQVEPDAGKPKKITEIPASPTQSPTGANSVADTTPVNGAPKPSQVTTNVNGDTEKNYSRFMDR